MAQLFSLGGKYAHFDIQNRFRRCLLDVMKHIFSLIIALPVFCLLAAGCAKSPRWQICQSQQTFGSNYEHVVYQPILLDTKTGKTWVYMWNDKGILFWMPVYQTNAPIQKVLQ